MAQLVERTVICDLCGSAHHERLVSSPEDDWYSLDTAYKEGWRQMSDGTRLLDYCPDCFAESQEIIPPPSK